MTGERINFPKKEEKGDSRLEESTQEQPNVEQQVEVVRQWLENMGWRGKDFKIYFRKLFDVRDESIDEKIASFFERGLERIREAMFSRENGDKRGIYNRYEIIPGEVEGSLLQLISAEYYKTPKKDDEDNFILERKTDTQGREEGVPFAEHTADNVRKYRERLENYPDILLTVMKDPSLVGIIDPDATGVSQAMRAKLLKKGVASEEIDKMDVMRKAYQLELLKILQEKMKEGQPFLHLAVSEKRKGDPNKIIIAGALRNGLPPANPVILNWIAETLQEKLKEEGFDDVRVVVHKEGQRLCGSQVHTARREVLGDLYNFAKIKVPGNILKGAGSIAAIAEIARDFHNEFPDEKSLQEYLEKNTTEEDKIRLEGKMYFPNGLQQSEEVSNNKIAMSRSLRKALGVEKGEEIVLHHNPENTKDPEVKYVLEVIPAFTSEDSLNKEKIGWRVPAINIDALKGKSVVIEKEVATPNRRAK